MAGTEDGVGVGKQKSSLSLHSWKDKVPACTSITAPIVARNSLPKMGGT